MNKAFLLSFILFSVSIKNFAATITWDGGGGNGQWNTAANWTGDIIPTPADDVILDNSSVAGNYTVTLPAGIVSVSINSLIIFPSGVNSIILVLPITNIADPGLFVTGFGEALVLNNGSTLRNSSGAVTGSGISITGIFRINNGARYIHNTNRGNAAIVSQLSTAGGTEFGEFEFDIPAVSTPISLSNRTYGTLILSSVANAGVTTYIGTGASPLHINGNLFINAGVTFSISMSADVFLDGNLVQASASTFNIQNSVANNFVRVKGDISIGGLLTESNTGLPKFEISGSVNQNISVTGNITNSVEFIINNAAGITLLSSVALPYHLQLISGKIHTTAANVLMLADGANCSGGSISSFVEGPMKKTGDDNFVFPVGEGGIYAPVGITNNANQQVTDQFTAQYFRQNPQAIYGTNYEPPIHHISYVEYWRLERNSGNASKFITLSVSATSFAMDAPSLRVARFDGSIWKHEGQSAFISGTPFPPYITGTLVSIPVTDFSFSPTPFTLASTIPEPQNPLPLQFLFLTAEKKVNKILLRWQMAGIPFENSIFEIERSYDGCHFKTIATMASVNSVVYNYLDIPQKENSIFYRIKMNNPVSGMIFSEIICVLNSTPVFPFITIYPNPVKDYAILRVGSGKQFRLYIRVLDKSAKMVKQLSLDVFPGNTALPVNLAGLSKGVYILSGSANGKPLASIQFIRE